ncbi:MAG: hypothetical protein IKO74_09630 [Selenomonadaceae bacterium]|nr:hypothetical protein [Selenomonadaceae bacterium]
MTITKLLKQLETIHHERTMEAHHDDIFFQTYDDVEALDRVINLIKFLQEKNSSDTVKVSELFKAANIDK